MNQSSTLFALVGFLLLGLAVPADAQHQHQHRKKTNMRLFWVDQSTQKLTWGDVVTTDKWALNTSTVDGFPEMDSKANRLSPLVGRNGMVVAGISGTADDKKKGRWVAIDSGVYQEPHGNHFHWKYTGRPTVTQTINEERQGRASRVSFVGEQLYLLGDKGFSTDNLNNLRIRGAATGTRKFFPATNWPVSQSTFVDNVVGYSAWDDSDGEHAGQVDVIKLADSTKPAYSFKLPSGDVSVTTFNSDKVFFAHKDTISWVTPDRSCSLGSDNVKVNQVNPANQDLKLESPPATFVNERNWVTFTTGKGESSKLCMIDAASPTPTVIALPIKVNEGLQLSAPKTILSLGKRYAFIFHQRSKPAGEGATDDIKEQLTIVELDPNRDMRFDDARIAKTIPVGKSLIKDDAGHHQVSFDAYGRFAVFTNPGDGTLSVMTMQDLQVRVNFKVDGVPTQIVAVGAPEHFH